MPTSISQAQLNIKMDDHELWLQSGGTLGAKLILIDYDLANLLLKDRDLSQAIFNTSIISGANYENTTLSLAKFINIAQGLETDFNHCIIDSADFSGSFMEGVIFNYAKIGNCNFSNANINKTQMIEVEALDANFSDADISESICSRGNFSRSIFLRATFESGYFADAVFAGADLTGVNFKGTVNTGVDFDPNKFAGATGIYSFGPIGDSSRIGFAVKHPTDPTTVYLGCFSGTLAETLTEVNTKYGAGSRYSQQVSLAVDIVENGSY